MSSTIKFIRYRKIGKYELYIYKYAGYYVLDEVEAGKRGHNVSYGTTLGQMLPIYNRCVKEAMFYN